jgi:hypothetical protein
MTITRQLPRIDDAIDAESWEWLQDNAPELATAADASLHDLAEKIQHAAKVWAEAGRQWRESEE